MKDGNPKVFVYGTLKSGHCNNGALENGTFLGKVTLDLPFQMVDLTYYPGLVPTPVRENEPPELFPITGEVYSIPRNTLDILDLIEGYPHYYSRRKIETEWGNAWVYFLPPSYLDRPIITGGEWGVDEDADDDAA